MPFLNIIKKMEFGKRKFKEFNSYKTPKLSTIRNGRGTIFKMLSNARGDLGDELLPGCRAECLRG